MPPSPLPGGPGSSADAATGSPSCRARNLRSGVSPGRPAARSYAAGPSTYSSGQPNPTATTRDHAASDAGVTSSTVTAGAGLGGASWRNSMAMIGVWRSQAQPASSSASLVEGGVVGVTRQPTGTLRA